MTNLFILSTLRCFNRFVAFNFFIPALLGIVFLCCKVFEIVKVGSNTVLAELSFRHAFYIVLVVRVVDIRLAWLVYFRTYSVPISTLAQNKRSRKLYLGDAQIKSKQPVKSRMMTSSSFFRSKLINVSSCLYFFAGALPVDITSLSPRVQQMHQQLTGFMKEHVYPNEAEFNRHQSSEHCWTPHPLLEKIKVMCGNHVVSSLLSLKDTHLNG